MPEVEYSNYYGEPKDIKRNIVLFFFDGTTFMPAMALLSIATVFPFFLEQLNATTFEFAIVTSVTSIGMLATQPIFGSMASRAKLMTRTFGKVLLAQRGLFLLYILAMPLFATSNRLMVWAFIISWSLFCLFSGSWVVFVVPIMLKILPPNKRGGMRGVGQALGSVIALGMAALIPFIIGVFPYPFDFMIIFSLGLFFLFLNAAGFLLMKEHRDVEPRVPMKVKEYLQEMPTCLKKGSPFRAMILSSVFLVLANSLLPFYTYYAIQVFYIDAYQIALLATIAIISTMIANITFGFLIDYFSPVGVSPLVSVFVIMAGVIALTSSNLIIFYIAWMFANIGNVCYMKATNLMIGDVSPPGKSPLYVGVLFIMSTALSPIAILVLAPVLEVAGFGLLFAVVTICGGLGFFYNVFVFQKRLRTISIE